MEILRLEPDTLYKVAEKAAKVLEKGGIVLFPTDTLYGLAADVKNPSAIERLKKIKARHTRKPISVIVPDHETLERYGVLSERARALANKYLPGALTLVVPVSGHPPEEIHLNGTLGFRIPNDPFALILARLFGSPYTATSANVSGVPTPPSVEAVIAHLGPSARYIDLVVDDGPREGGVPSTVVAIVGEEAYMLREGVLSKADLGI